MRERWIIAITTVMALLLLDQIIKIWIKTNMAYEDTTFDLGFFHIFFIENNGMAFGTELGGKGGKLALTLFRLVAIAGIGWYLFRLIKRGGHPGLIFSMALIFAGAFGNIIDSMFYGMMFDVTCPCMDPNDGYCFHTHPYCMTTEPANFTSFGDGYAGLFHGKVVDMFQFTAKWPEWVPWVGGSKVFPPIFNLADSAITIGVMIIILRSKKFFPDADKFDWNIRTWFKKKEPAVATVDESPNAPVEESAPTDNLPGDDPPSADQENETT